MTTEQPQVGRVKLPSGEVVSLRRVLRNAGSRRYFLASHYDNAGFAECLCRSAPIEMRIGYRPAHGIYYLYTARHGTPHSEDCHYYRPAGAFDLRNGSAPIVERDGLVIVDLPGATAALPSRDNAREGLSATRERGEPGEGAGKPSARHADVQVLLELLLVRSGLTEWRPGFAGKRQYGRARWRLVSAAEEVEFQDGTNLADRLYSPPPFRKVALDEIRSEWNDFTSRVQAAGPSARFFMLGVLKSLTEAKFGSFRAKLGQFAEPIWIPGHLCKGWSVNERGQSLVLLQLYFGQKSSALRAAGAARVTLDENWLPAATPEDDALIQYLHSSKRTFRRTFPWQSGNSDTHGDFIVDDLEHPVHILVLPASATPQHVGEVALRRGRLEEQGHTNILFDGRQNPSLPEIPSA